MYGGSTPALRAISLTSRFISIIRKTKSEVGSSRSGGKEQERANSRRHGQTAGAVVERHVANVNVVASRQKAAKRIARGFDAEGARAAESHLSGVAFGEDGSPA